MKRNTIMYIKSVYNGTMEKQCQCAYNIFMSLAVAMDEHDQIHITERVQKYEDYTYSEVSEESYSLGHDPVAVLCFERNVYEYFHCYAVARSGGHLNYDLVEWMEDGAYLLPDDIVKKLINYNTSELLAKAYAENGGF